MAVSLATIEETVELGKSYFAELILYDYSGAIAGYCEQYTSKLTCLNRLIRALTWDINGEYNTDNTQRLYEMLLVQISTYSGAVLPVDPNVVIPGSAPIVIVQNYVTPVKLYFTNSSAPGVADWQTDYADSFGNDPTFALYLYNGVPGSYTEQTGAVPTVQFDDTDTLLQSFSYDFGFDQTGYILIST